jgi:hypothetical protein
MMELKDCSVEPRKMHISMSTADPDLSEGLTLAIQKELGNPLDVSIVEHSGVGQLLSYVESSPVDLFILVLNNLMFADTTMFTETRGWRSLEVVSHLRETYGKPVIALAASWPNEMSQSEVEEEAIKAGASVFFWLPYNRRRFIGAVEQCLRQVTSRSSS